MAEGRLKLGSPPVQAEYTLYCIDNILLFSSVYEAVFIYESRTISVWRWGARVPFSKVGR